MKVKETKEKPKMGRPRIMDKPVTMSFDLDKKLYDLMSAEAVARGVSKSTVLRDALHAALYTEDV
jgi:hypothetical protein